MLHLNCLILFLRSNLVTLSHILEEVFLLFCFAFFAVVVFVLFHRLSTIIELQLFYINFLIVF